MNALMLAYAALLFVVLTPGVLLRLPPNASKMTVALTHGAIFAVVWHFTNKMVWRASYEGFQSIAPKPTGFGATIAPKPTGFGATKTPSRISMNSPEVDNAQARVNDANNRVQAIQNKYNNAEQIAVNIENELIDARKQLQNAEQQLRVVQGLPQTEPIRQTMPLKK